jgi:hypothetical protein
MRAVYGPRRSPTIEYQWEGQLRSAINHNPTSDWIIE